MSKKTFPIVSEKMFIQATRDSGYRSTANAIAELVDNALQAESTHVWIFVDEKIEDSRRQVTVSVLDDGFGMDPYIMQLALQFGGSNRFDNRNGLGRFGMGLPNSSVSQCRRVELYSWQEVGRVYQTYLDVDELVDGGLEGIPKPTQKELPKPERSLSGDSGTLVVWRHCDRLDYRKANTIAAKLPAPLGRKFRHFLFEGSQILINNVPIKPIDPLFRHKDAVLSGAKEYCPTLAYQFRDEGEKSPSGDIRVKFALLPISEWHQWSVDKKRYFGITGGAGVSIVRAGREIAYGWYFMGKKRRQNYDDWWRCEVTFDPTLDEYFGVNHSKQDVRPHRELREILSRDLEGIARNLYSRVREEFSILALEPPSKSVITAEHRERYLPPLIKMATENGGKKRKARLHGSSDLRYYLEVQQLLDPAFFRWRLNSNVMRLTINADHPFYTEILVPLRKAGRWNLVHNLECLLLSHARSAMLAHTGARRQHIDDHVAQWSNILAAFLT